MKPLKTIKLFPLVFPTISLFLLLLPCIKILIALLEQIKFVLTKLLKNIKIFKHYYKNPLMYFTETMETYWNILTGPLKSIFIIVLTCISSYYCLIYYKALVCFKNPLEYFNETIKIL